MSQPDRSSPSSESSGVPLRPRRRPRGAALAVAAAAVMGLSLVAAPAAAEESADETAFQHYVALGDSFTSGPDIRPYQSGTGSVCHRSSLNYAQLAADQLGVAEFTDVSCSGAVTTDFYESQHEEVGPQLDALTAETDLVTVGIGGNDAGFAEIVATCVTRGLTDPLRNPCERHYGDELDERVEELREVISGVYGDVAERSPNATVLSVGYLQLLPESHGCWPREPIAKGDVAFLDRLQTSLNTMIAEESAAHGAVSVDVLERGHDMCVLGPDRWVEGVIPKRPAAGVHPNAEGMAAVADRITAELGGEHV